MQNPLYGIHTYNSCIVGIQPGGCPWCGNDGACCKKNKKQNQCDGFIGGEKNFQCTQKPGITKVSI